MSRAIIYKNAPEFLMGIRGICFFRAVNLAPESYLSLWDADYPLLISKAGLLVNVDFEKDQTINLSIKSANVFFNAIEN
jgi:hypothetical protein